MSRSVVHPANSPTRPWRTIIVLLAAFAILASACESSSDSRTNSYSTTNWLPTPYPTAITDFDTLRPVTNKQRIQAIKDGLYRDVAPEPNLDLVFSEEALAKLRATIANGDWTGELLVDTDRFELPVISAEFTDLLAKRRANNEAAKLFTIDPDRPVVSLLSDETLALFQASLIRHSSPDKQGTLEVEIMCGSGESEADGKTIRALPFTTCRHGAGSTLCVLGAVKKCQGKAKADWQFGGGSTWTEIPDVDRGPLIAGLGYDLMDNRFDIDGRWAQTFDATPARTPRVRFRFP